MIEIPEELIAKYPLLKRDEARLLIYKKNEDKIEERLFNEILEYLHPEDIVVINSSKVIKALITGKKETGGRIKLLYVKYDSNKAYFLATPKIKKPLKVFIKDVKLDFECENGMAVLRIPYYELKKIIDSYGSMPLPPYIKREPEKLDEEYYQNIYAKHEGSIAAPTAGLHFTYELLNKIKKVVDVCEVVCHIGVATFRIDRSLESERCMIPHTTAKLIKNKKGRIIATGTSVVRTLEGCYKKFGDIIESEFLTDIFIKPGYEFKVVDSMITNFHQPGSPPFHMVSAFLGSYEKLENIYKIAVEKRYRFLSYGDAMLII